MTDQPANPTPRHTMWDLVARIAALGEELEKADAERDTLQHALGVTQTELARLRVAHDHRGILIDHLQDRLAVRGRTTLWYRCKAFMRRW